jgi:glutathione reductase (NADPH)
MRLHSLFIIISSVASAFSPLRALLRPLSTKTPIAFFRREMSSTTTTTTATTATATDETHYDYDFVVIGGGSGGVRASRIAAGHGARTLLIESQFQHGIDPYYSAIGGTCVNVGCVPKKLMVFASRFPADMAEAAGYGWDTNTVGTFHWDRFMQHKNEEISRLNNIYKDDVLAKAGVEMMEGTGRLNGPHTVDITVTATGETKSVTAKYILISVGSWPYKPKIPGVEHTVTSNEIFYLKEQPKRVVVVGGGFIGVEFAGILSGLGSKVTLQYRKDLFLRGFDYDMRTHLRDEMQRHSDVDIQFNTNPAEIVKNDDGSLTVITEDGRRTECDAVMYAIGRNGKINGLGLETAGVEVVHSFIPVNDYSQTNVPHIYAVGDITNRKALTPVALMEGHRLADTLFGGLDRPVDHAYVASTVFSNPEIGTVGYTEEEAAAKFKDITVYKTRFRPMKHAFPKKDNYSLFKLIVETATDKVVGCHIATDSAGDMIQGVAIAVKMGATKADFDATIGIHPTSAEELVTMRTPSYHYKNGVKVE